jgi:23S rRNA (cytidine2498-2'-O)-methyltransferase
MDLLLYCRAGYEADLMAELEQKLALTDHYGYANMTKDSAFVRFCLPQLTHIPSAFESIKSINVRLPKLTDLVFARQKLHIIDDVTFDGEDRISILLSVLQTYDLPKFSDVFVEYPDSQEGKKLAKFCKKFTVPLRSRLRQQDLLFKKPSNNQPFLHLFFEHSGKCILAISVVTDRSIDPLGIKRLKMPNAAPSRSTLKLEEAINVFFNQDQAQALFCAGMRASDLGACPGGWTYQLIQRKIVVEAVDHGEIAANLMVTGLVEYYSEDGFLYQPQQGNVDWLVCDMIEQPTRVSELMLSWLESGKANACIFNLKLPMNKRHKVVDPILKKLQSTLTNRFGHIIIKAKHLYHNRDEVTVLIIVNTQMLNCYNENKRQGLQINGEIHQKYSE